MTTTVKILALIWFGSAVRMRTWNKLATQIKNRMSLEDALRRLHQQARERKSPLEEIYAHILTVMAQGRTLGQALEGLASREEIMLIGSAQASARLVEGLSLAEKVLKAQGSIRKSLVIALANPCMLFIACIAMLLMIALQVMPQLAMISDPASWTGTAHLLHGLSSFVASWAGVVSGILFFILIVSVCFSFSHWTGPLRRLADRCIPWSIYRLTVGTGWLYTVATRMRAGHQLSQILAGMLQGTSPYLREVVGAILDKSRKGMNFGLALQESGMEFPSREIVDALRIYANQPGFQEYVTQLADDWLQEGVETVAGLAQKIGFLMYALVIGLLLLVVDVAMNFQSNIQIGGM